MKKILITGIAGFMGGHLARKFIEEGNVVVGIDNLIGGYIENVPLSARFIQADLNDLEEITPFFNDIDVVVHSACTAYEGLSVFSPSVITKNTFQITANTISAAIAGGVKKFVNMSSMARYGTQKTLPFVEEMIPMPQDPYGIAKYASELLLANLSKVHNLKYATVVPHNIIGPGQKYDDPYRNVASIMANRMLRGKQPIIYGSGNQKRCFSFMQDVVEPIWRICNTDVADGMTINIGPDEEFITINELAGRIAKIIGFKLDPIYLPERPQEVFHANCSANLARNLLDYKTTTTLDEGLNELVSWIAQRGPREFSFHLPIEIKNEMTPKTWTTDLMNQ